MAQGPNLETRRKKAFCAGRLEDAHPKILRFRNSVQLTYYHRFNLIETPWKYVNARTYFFTSRGIETIRYKVIIANSSTVQCISYAIMPFKFVKMYLNHNFRLDQVADKSLLFLKVAILFYLILPGFIGRSVHSANKLKKRATQCSMR